MPDPLGKKSLEDAQSLTRPTSLNQHIQLKVATTDIFLLSFISQSVPTLMSLRPFALLIEGLTYKDVCYK